MYRDNQNRKDDFKCFRCGEKGHKQLNCPDLEKREFSHHSRHSTKEKFEEKEKERRNSISSRSHSENAFKNEGFDNSRKDSLQNNEKSPLN